MADGADRVAFTCISCRVAFADADLQRAHYKSDWHRYNLKRKVAELPPVTAENFQQRVLAQRAQLSEGESQASTYCALCAKSFSSKNAYENHQQSKKHRDCELRQQGKQQTEVEQMNEKNLEKDADKAESGQPSSSSTDTGPRLKDMKNEALKAEMRAQQGASGDTTQQAGGTEDMDTDNESEESWDGEALGLEECLFCSHVSKTMEANLSHMTRLHSFFIPDLEFVSDLEGLVTYLGEKVGEGHICLWCNEKSKAFLSVRSAQQHMLDKGHCKLLFDGEAVFEYSDYYDYRKSYPDEETGQAEMEEGGDEEGEVAPELLSDDNFQLVLPSGSTVGHRSLQRYYRQKLKAERPRISTAISKVMATYRALGWTGTTGVAAERRAKDVAFVQRIKARRLLKVGTKANNQTHFRDDNCGIRH